jgi:hypothetical protein
VTWIAGLGRAGRGGTGPLSVREIVRKDPDFRRSPWKLGFLKDLNELEDGLTVSSGVDASLSVDLSLLMTADRVGGGLVVESYR